MVSAPLWTAQEIVAATGGTANGEFAVNGLAFDSREVAPGDLFLAMRGEAADGHDFLDKAFAAGAAAAVVERPIDRPHVLVEDSFRALQALGKASRARTAARIIGVTGSVGKTGTKEALFAALDRYRSGFVHRSVKSYNNHVGVPLSLARMPKNTLFGVFEMGMNHAGELSELTRLVRPDVAIITAIAPAHIAFFGSIEAIAEAKSEIFEGLMPGGTAIVPFDSPHLSQLYNTAKTYASQVWTFGQGEGADVRAIEFVAARDGGSLVTARLPDAELCYTVAPAGDHWVSNSLAVLAAVEALGADLASAGLALAEMAGLPGRGARCHLRVKDGQALLIDESYNANPLSMAATLRQLGREDAKRRIAVLGAMKELGDQSGELHANLAEPILDARVDAVILVGDDMEPLARGLEGRLVLAHVPDAAGAVRELRGKLGAGDAVLVKGSNSVGLSRVVAELTGGEN